MRLDMRQTEFFYEMEANLFFQLFSDPMKQPLNFDLLKVTWYKQGGFTSKTEQDNKPTSI